MKELESIIQGVIGARADIERRALSIKITYKDGPQLQLLPAVPTATGTRIPAADGDGWSRVVHPEKFATMLTDLNQNLQGRVVPVIKLVKAAINSLDIPMKGYHIEALALKAFQNYQGSLTPKAMVQHFFEKASDLVKRPVKDQTGQSIYVDDYLGSPNSDQREQVSRTLDSVTQRMNQADTNCSTNDWLRSIDALS